MNKWIDLFAGIVAIVLILIGSAVVAGLWLGMAFWHAKAFFEFLP
jgi:hypothetical protein